MNSRAHQVKVLDVITETADAVSVVFDIPGDLTERFHYQPGQFVTVQIPSAQTGSVARCYSLSSSPYANEQPAITVKRTAGGYASNWICDNLEPGAVVTLLEPAGNFTPRTLDSDVVLCAAGSGITPVISIAKSVLAAGDRKVTLFYANRDRDSVIFADRIGQLGRSHPGRLVVHEWLETDAGIPTVEAIASLLEPYSDRDVFVCGPQGFMSATREALVTLGVASDRICTEEYKSLDDNPFEHRLAKPAAAVDVTSGGTHLRVEIDGETHEFAWPTGTTLLDLLLDNGIDAPYVCRESACGTCVCSVKAGRTRMLMNESLIDDELEMGLTLACQTLAESEKVHIAFDQ